MHEVSTKLNGLTRLNFKPDGRPGKLGTLENLNTWSLEVFPQSHGLRTIESHLWMKIITYLKISCLGLYFKDNIECKMNIGQQGGMRLLMKFKSLCYLKWTSIDRSMPAI